MVIWMSLGLDCYHQFQPSYLPLASNRFYTEISQKACCQEWIRTIWGDYVYLTQRNHYCGSLWGADKMRHYFCTCQYCKFCQVTLFQTHLHPASQIVRYFSKTNSTAFTNISLKWAQFYLSSKIITIVSLFGPVNHSSADAYCQHCASAQA